MGTMDFTVRILIAYLQFTMLVSGLERCLFLLLPVLEPPGSLIKAPPVLLEELVSFSP